MYVYYLYINMYMISMKKSPITLKFKVKNCPQKNTDPQTTIPNNLV